MKAYYYGERRPGLVQKLMKFVSGHGWAAGPGILLMLFVWVFVWPVLRLLVGLGELGHLLAGWVGYDSREWY